MRRRRGREGGGGFYRSSFGGHKVGGWFAPCVGMDTWQLRQ